MEFNPLSDDFFNDPYDTYRWLRDEQPCYFNERFGFYALSRFDDVVAAHRDWRTFSNEHGLSLDTLLNPDANVKGQSIIMMDPPDHDRMRKLVSRAFTPRAITRMEPIALEVMTKYLDRAADQGSFDAVADFAAPFPVEVISAILGVPEADRQQIRHWTDTMLMRLPNDPNPPPESLHAALEQTLYFFDLIKDKRANQGEDMIDQLILAEVEGEDGSMHRLTDEEVAGFSTLIAAAGSETVTKLVGSAVVLFHRNPDEWAKVLGDRTKIVNAVEETLRYWAPSQYQGRFSHLDSEWHGVTIPAGHPVFLITGAANRDPREYDDPDRFDVDREIGLSVGLGHGVHACLGAALARLESRMAIELWAERFPSYEVDEDGCRRVNMSNVAGYSNVPVTIG